MKLAGLNVCHRIGANEIVILRLFSRSFSVWSVTTHRTSEIQRIALTNETKMKRKRRKRKIVPHFLHNLRTVVIYMLNVKTEFSIQKLFVYFVVVAGDTSIARTSSFSAKPTE